MKLILISVCIEISKFNVKCKFHRMQPVFGLKIQKNKKKKF